MSDELEDLKMDELREIGEPLGLSFGPGVSKAHARDAIRAAQVNPADGEAEDNDQVTDVAQAEPDDVDADVDADIADTPDGETETRDIVRTGHQGIWWCPFCDHCSPAAAAQCGGCGATRDNDQAVL